MYNQLNLKALGPIRTDVSFTDPDYKSGAIDLYATKARGDIACTSSTTFRTDYLIECVSWLNSAGDGRR